MSPLEFSESDLGIWCKANPRAFADSGFSATLPFGFGRLEYRTYSLETGVDLTVRRGVINKPIALTGKDCEGTEIGFQLINRRGVWLDSREVLADDRPLLSIYQSGGGQPFKICESPCRDATYVEFSFKKGSMSRLSPTLADSVKSMLSKGRRVGSATLFTQQLSSRLLNRASKIAQTSFSSMGEMLTTKRHAYALLCDLENTREQALLRSNEERAFWAAEILRSRLAAPPTPDELAKTTGTTPNRLRAAFRIAHGQTMRQFITAERMRRAMERLDNETLSVSQLSWELGYQSTSHFIQAFRRNFGITPKAFLMQRNR